DVFGRAEVAIALLRAQAPESSTLIQMAISAADELRGGSSAGKTWAAVLPFLDEAHRSEVLPRAVETVLDMPDELRMAQTLAILAPFIVQAGIGHTVLRNAEAKLWYPQHRATFVVAL